MNLGSFSTKNNFINLESLDGVTYKSKKINIVFKKTPLEIPEIVERLVFGPFASYESAQRQAKKLEDKGYKVRVAYPKNWEVWVPVSEELPDSIFNEKSIFQDPNKN